MRDARFEFGEFGSEREIFLLNEGAVLFGVDVGGVGFGLDGLEFVEEASDEGVGLVGDERDVVGASGEVLVGEK